MKQGEDAKTQGQAASEQELYKVAVLVSSEKQQIYIARNKAGNIKGLVQEYALNQVTDMDLAGLATQCRLLYPHVLQIRRIGPIRRDGAIVVRIVYEYADNGTLFDILKQKNQFSEERARWFFQQLALAVDYCHRRDIGLWDLKLTNILVNQKGVLKLANFQLAQNLASSNPATKLKGTLQYMPPERLSPPKGDSIPDVKGNDVWSMGVILYTMIAGKYPFDLQHPSAEVKDRKVRQRILDGEYDQAPLEGVSADLQDLLQGMLAVNPDDRLTLPDIMAHRWTAHATPPTYQSFNHSYRLDIDRFHVARQNLDKLDGMKRKLAELQQEVFYKFGSEKARAKRILYAAPEAEASSAV